MKYNITKHKLEAVIKKSKSFRGAGRVLNINHRLVKIYAEKYGVDISHFDHGKRQHRRIGKKFGMLTIVSIANSGDKNRHQYAECLCDCGNTYSGRIDSVVSGRVPSCGCISKNRFSISGQKNPAFNGVGEIRAYHFENIRRSAKRRDIEFDLQKDYLWNLFVKQEGKCAISRMPIAFGRIHFCHETTASLDRIDSNLGYIESNVQWVHKDINKLKRDFNESYFIELCKKVTKHNHQSRRNFHELATKNGSG